MSEQSFVILWNPWVMQSGKKINTCSSIFLNSLLWILPSWCCSRNFENSSLTSSSDIPLEKVKKWTKADEIQTLWHRHGDEGGQCMEWFQENPIPPGFDKGKHPTWIWKGKKSHLDLARYEISSSLNSGLPCLHPILQTWTTSQHPGNFSRHRPSAHHRPQLCFKRAFLAKMI